MGGVDCKAVRKDFVKLICESATVGKSFVHLLQARDHGTFPALIARYNEGFKIALRDARKDYGYANVSADRAWFSLFVLVMCDRCEAGDPARLHFMELGSLAQAVQTVDGGGEVFSDALTCTPLC